ncbi:MAG: VWA domain-containing protein [Filomicrobium sp.]
MANNKTTKTDQPTNRHATPEDHPAPAETNAKSQQVASDEARSSESEVADFLSKMESFSPKTKAGNGRLIFAMDATMSRQPTWDMALSLQSEMFAAVRDVGGLHVQLMYFRGFGECRASKWVSEPMALQRLMTQISCQGGHTQIGKVLSHARKQAEQGRVDAVVFVGDAMEERVDDLCMRAGELGLLGVPVFVFQEGYDVNVERAFKEIARLTKGAWCRFDSGSAAQLRELLTAVAVFAAGGRKALEQLAHKKGAQLLLEQLNR